ncbi:MAG: HAD hydrolase-like protein [Phycisphaerales bacterium]|nr:HAD hydrolase-like protein [Phycisphaerales bacterium]
MTLLETNHIGIDCLHDAGKALFNKDFTIEGISFGGCLDPVIIAAMLELNGVEPTADAVGAMRRGYHERLAAHAESRSIARSLPGSHELVDAVQMHDSSPTVGLLTGNYEETGTLKIRSAGFDPSVFVVNAWGDGSPHPEPLRSHLPPVAMENYQGLKGRSIDPESVVIIGDTIHDVSCAKDNGCRVLAVATGHAGFDELVDAGADRTVEDLTDTEGIMRWMMDE